MRRFILSVVLVGVAVVVQLSMINGLRLPAGGVPDLALVVIAALGLAGGPVAGATAGFAAGLCLDLAPPGSGIAGVYALVFCLVGWACGRCRGTLARSALLPIIIAATAAVLGEIMIAGLGMALQPAQVTWNSVRQVLPAALFYDVAISPFVLYLVLLASAWLDEAPATAGQARLRRVRAQGGVLAASTPSGRAGLASTAGASGSAGGAVLLGLGGWLAGPPQGRRARKAAARHSPRLSPGSGRARDGWIGGSAARRALGGAVAGQVLRGQGLRGQVLRGPGMRGQAFGGQALRGAPVSGHGRGSRPHGSGAARLRSGVAGSAAPGQMPRTLAARPVHLHLAGGRKRDGAVGNMLGVRRPALAGGRGRRADPGRRRRGRGHGFRPSVMPGGSALAGQPRPIPLAATGPTRFGSGKFGSARLGSGIFGSGRSGSARLGSARRRDGVVGGGVLTQIGRTGRAPAAPRFRIRTDRSSAGLRGARLAGAGLGGTALSAGGGQQTLYSLRGRAPRRLRMRPRRRDGALGSGGPAGGGRLAGSRPATPRFRARPLASGRPMNGKRPRFGYRRWAIVSVLTRRHGSLTGLWRRPGRRTGGLK